MSNMFTNLIEFKDHYGPLIRMICGYLECNTLEEICDVVPKSVEREDDGYFEVWELPEDFEIVLEMDNVCTPGFSIGKLWFGKLNNELCVAETNASPIAFYGKRSLTR